MSNLQNQLWPPLENALAQSQPLPLLPIELICEVVRLASCESLDVSLEWTTNLALLSQSLLSTVRAVIYELFVVGQRVQDEDLNDQSRVHADPSVREFLIMMTDSSDHRRQCVRCLVFFRRPEELALEGWNGPGWSIDTIVSAISGEGVNNEGEPIPSIPIQTRRFASYVHYAHTNAKGCGEHYAHLRFDVNLATVGTITLTPGHDTYVHFSARDDDKLDKHTVSILYTAVSGADVVMIFSPGATVLALGDVKVTEEHKRILCAAIEALNFPVIDHNVRRKVRWSTRDWTRSMLEHPEQYRDMCATILSGTSGFHWILVKSRAHDPMKRRKFTRDTVL